MQQTSLNKQLVLIGGGHANVQVLRKLCMNEYKGLNVVLISESYGAIYSGMTPGYIEKLYSLEEITIDLQRLCFNAGATFIKDKVVRMDENNQILYLKDNPFIPFDILSINSGSISNKQTIHIENDSKVIHVKPINRLVSKINLIDEIIEKSSQKKVSIIGGGVAGFELSFALHKRYSGNISLDIISKHLLEEKNLNKSSIYKIKKIARNMNINLISKQAIAINNSEIKVDDEEVIYSDLILLSTGASLPKWLAQSKLEMNEKFIAVNQQLQSLNFKNIFVSGDAASIKNSKRPKSGVMAVRQGEILRDNLFLFLQNKSLKKFKPQKNWLYLIGTCKKSAILNYFNFSFEGNWCWALKKLIDLNFMNKFSFSEQTNMNKKIISLSKNKEDIPKMYCQGCGSKVSKNTLINFLYSQKTNTELSDAAEIKFKQNYILQTIDHIKLFNSINPYEFGIISYLHSQNDILVSGGEVDSLSVSIGVPFSENLVESFYLNYFMKGIERESHNNNSLIVAGHSYHTLEPSITITMNGITEKKSFKSGANEGDLIYLSKPLGTGYLLAAYFQNSKLFKHQDFHNLMTHLKMSNKLVVNIARKFECQTMTDISGFGLASHLIDICKNSNLSAHILLNDEILINSNKDLLNKFESTGFRNNYLSSFEHLELKKANELIKIMYDPQTNGPVLVVLNKKFKNEFEKNFIKIYQSNPIKIGTFTKQDKKLISIE